MLLLLLAKFEGSSRRRSPSIWVYAPCPARLDINPDSTTPMPLGGRRRVAARTHVFRGFFARSAIGRAAKAGDTGRRITKSVTGGLTGFVKVWLRRAPLRRARV